MNPLSSTDSYLSLILSLPHLAPMTILAIFFLTMARTLPILALVPFFGAQNVPMTIRVMFGAALTAIFLPQNLFTVHGEIPFAMPFIGYCIKELFIGLILGFLASCPFYIAQMSGGLIDFQRGASSLQVTDPTTRTQTGALGILYNYVLIVIFFALGGPFYFLNAVATSYTIIPVDQVVNAALFNPDIPFWKTLMNTLQLMFNLCIQLAAPSLIALMLSDMFLGIANRLAPQVQIVFLGIPVKSWVGIALLAAAWSLIIQVMGRESIQWMHTIYHAIEQFYPRGP